MSPTPSRTRVARALGLGFALAVAGWLVVSLSTRGPLPAQAAEGQSKSDSARPAERILADIDAVEVPRLDPDKRGDTQAMTEFLLKRKAALARRGELVLELFRGYPDHPRLLVLFTDRWQNLLLTSSDAPVDPRFAAELDEVIAGAKDDKLKADAAFFKAILEVQNSTGDAEAILKTVEKFIEFAPKDERGAMLLKSVADELDGSPRQAELLKRIAANYPDSRFAESAKVSLKKLESVGKPFALEFTDAISGTKVAMKNLKGKVVVVDFWATWCGPCVHEMPTMKELYSRFHGQNVEFIGVSLDEPREEGGLDKLKDFVTRNGITWPQYYQGKGWESEFSSSWAIDAIPAVFVVDQQGNLYSTNARGRLEEIIPELLKKGASNK
jgi:thiol-disulfide isomerase/thioredoxin